MKIFYIACCILLSFAVHAQNDTAVAAYTGKYTTKEGSKISVYIESGKLMISGDKGTAPLVREQTDSFSIEGYTGVGYVKFIRGKNPAVISAVHVLLEDMNIDVIADKDSAAATSLINIKHTDSRVPVVLQKSSGIEDHAFVAGRDLLFTKENGYIRKIQKPV